VSQGFQDVVHSCLDPDPALRPSAQQLAKVAQQMLAERQQRRRRRQHPTHGASLGGIGGGIVGRPHLSLGAAVLAETRKQPRKSEPLSPLESPLMSREQQLEAELQQLRAQMEAQHQ
jgi:hypothetical protein